MAADDLTAVVVGGGIGGLASALALAQAGWRVTVLERAPAFGEVGAGLATTGNGMTALAALGLDQAIGAAAYQTGTAGMQDEYGRWIMRMPDTRSDPRAVTTIWGLQRQRLHGVLREAAEASGAIELVTNAEVVAVQAGQPGGDRAVVTWRRPDQGRRSKAELVVAADGVRSAVRAQLFPMARARYSGSTSWRAVIPDTDTDGRLIQAWGPGTEFGSLRVSPAEIYWYGYFRNPEGAVFADELAAARERFADWAPRVRGLVGKTTADRLIRHDVYHLPGGLPAYTSGRAVFVGDAAHAMLPTAGQGAATALEDGVCVGRLIGAPVQAGGDLAAALAAYDGARRPRCKQIARTAILTARFGCDLGGGWRQPVRNAIFRLLPPAPLLKAGQSIVRWTAP
ncbi:MAG: NAD(P)/FAD-dependent oxidoreductase [Trebonia sp.]|jgi:2-polyprenyl-6-methoxyphenol hydroxylase-like FAD-dependent oxidoreductase